MSAADRTEEAAPVGPGARGEVPERCAREVRRAIDPHRAAADVLARWGAGGLLADLQRLATQHGPELPAEVEALVVPLSMALAAFAPDGSLSGGLAWRATPCSPCAGEVRVARLDLAEEGRDGE